MHHAPCQPASQPPPHHHTTYTPTHTPPPHLPACCLPQGGGVVSYRAKVKKIGGQRRDPGAAKTRRDLYLFFEAQSVVKHGAQDENSQTVAAEREVKKAGAHFLAFLRCVFAGKQESMHFYMVLKAI